MSAPAAVQAGPPAGAPASAAPPLATGTLMAIAAAKIALQLAAITRYGYFRDELYYLASTAHLDWGYVEHPPLSIALLALVRALLGDSLPALRIVPVLAGVVTVLLAGVIARQLGGGRFAQGIAALAVVLSPEFLAMNHYYSMNALELLLWAIAASLLIRALEVGAPRHWIGLGVVMGLGLLNKISMLWFGGGLALALLLTPHRRALATRWPWIVGAIAGVLFAPHVIWQVRHGWPTLQFMHNATAHKMVAVPPADFLLHQVLDMNPASAPLWISGILFGLLAPARRHGQSEPPEPETIRSTKRVLVLIYLAVFTLLITGGRSRSSYLAPAYPMLLALGGIAIERWTRAPRGVWVRGAVAVLLVVVGVAAIPFALPLLPVETFIRYQRAMGMAPRTEERQEVGPLPQQYADMFGWEEMVALVAKAYQRLTPEERRHCRVFGQDYGQAGAVDVLGRRLGLPRAISGHNSYWLWGPGDFDGSVLIIIGGDRADNAQFFEDIEIVGQTQSKYSMPYERGLDVSIARRPRVNLREAWPRLRLYI